MPSRARLWRPATVAARWRGAATICATSAGGSPAARRAEAGARRMASAVSQRASSWRSRGASMPAIWQSNSASGSGGASVVGMAASGKRRRS